MVPTILAGHAGFEPANTAVKVLCLNLLANAQYLGAMALKTGFEPVLTS